MGRLGVGGAAVSGLGRQRLQPAAGSQRWRHVQGWGDPPGALHLCPQLARLGGLWPPRDHRPGRTGSHPSPSPTWPSVCPEFPALHKQAPYLRMSGSCPLLGSGGQGAEALWEGRWRMGGSSWRAAFGGARREVPSSQVEVQGGLTGQTCHNGHSLPACSLGEGPGQKGQCHLASMPGGSGLLKPQDVGVKPGPSTLPQCREPARGFRCRGPWAQGSCVGSGLCVCHVCLHT